LKNDQSLLTHAAGKFFQAFGLQQNEAVGQFQRLPRGAASLQIVVEISPGKSHDDGSVRMELGKLPDGGCALPGMQCNEQVSRLPIVSMLNANFMSKLP
jgi:hypothetical protein